MITGGDKNTIVGMGDACKNPRDRGGKPVFSNAISRKLAIKSTFCWVNEMRTSAVCCRCLAAVKMQGLRVPHKIVDGEQKYKRLYGVRCCETSTCLPRRLWNRDVNAAINILRRLRRDLAREAHPLVFSQRGRLPYAVVLQVNEEAEEEERVYLEGL
jgi:hypothetical protein